MRRAIELSQVAADGGNFPFGAVLVSDGEIVEEATNCVATLGGDVTAHAETTLVRYMCGQPGGRGVAVPPERRKSCTVYSSAEPCVMCAGALFWSGVGRVVYGCQSAKMQEISGPGGFDLPVGELYAKCDSRVVDTQGPLLEEEALTVHRNFWAGRKRGAPLPAADSTEAKRRKPAATGTSAPPANGDEDTAGADAAAVREVQLEAALFASGGKGGGTAYAGSAPVIDMSQPEEQCAAAMWAAAREVGFFTVVNHGIPQQAIDSVFSASSVFFAQPQAAKEAQCPFAAHLNSGYEFMKQVRPSTGTPDQKESLQITARAGAMEGRWPTEASFEPLVRSFTAQAYALGQRILRLLEPKACPHVSHGTLAGAHTLWADDGQCTLRLLHYPPVQPEELPPNYWRAGPHTDWCCVTLLFQQPGNAGLECAANPRASGSSGSGGWLKVDPVEGGIAINIGDMLSRWSDDRLLSNLHRVRMPTPEEATPPRSRNSVAFFMQADKRVLIESQHGAITAGDYILGRIRSNFSAKK